MDNYSPNLLMQELRQIQSDASRGVQALYDAEVAWAEAEAEADLALQTAFIRAEGTVADRTAVSRVESSQARLQADLRKAELNRIKQKIKVLEQAQMSTQTISRLLEAEMRMG